MDLGGYIKEINLNDFEKEKNIGYGSFADVFLIRDKKTGHLYAAKILNKIDTSKEVFFKRLGNELVISYKIQHPCILAYRGFCSHDFDGNPYPMIITDYEENGSLYRMLELKRNENAPTEFNDTIKYINMYGIAQGMKFIHENKITHRDLKTLNVLLDKNFYPIIADFGLAKFLDPDDPNHQSTNRGTTVYQAPEIFLSNRYSYKVDVYAYGIILYEIVTEKSPYYEIQNKYCLTTKVPQGLRPSFPKEINEEMKSFIEECWDHDPDKRPTFSEIVKRLEESSLMKSMNVDEDKFNEYRKQIEAYYPQFNRESVLVPYEDANSQRLQNFNEGYTPSVNQKQKIFQEINKRNKDIEFIFMIAKSLCEGIEPYQKDYELGIHCLNLAKSLGSIEATLYLGEIYFQLGESDNSKNILEYFVKDNPKAKLILAKIELGNENPDYNIVKEYLREASSDLNYEAMVEYGKLLMKHGKPLKNNLSISLDHFKAAAEIGNPEAQAYLSLFYYYGYGVVEFDFEKAAELSRKSYEEGKNMMGGAIYAECLAKGRGTVKDENKAVEIAKESSENNNSKGMNKYGEFLNIGIGGIKQDKKKAAKLWKKSAEKGDAEGKFLYASCLLEGEEYGVIKDHKKAIKLLKESIEEGCITAKALLGQLQLQGFFEEDYADSISLDENIKNGIKNIKDAADLGDDFGIIIYCQFLANRMMDGYDSSGLIDYLTIGIKRGNHDCMKLYKNLYRQNLIQNQQSELQILDICKEEKDKDKDKNNNNDNNNNDNNNTNNNNTNNQNDNNHICQIF